MRGVPFVVKPLSQFSDIACKSLKVAVFNLGAWRLAPEALHLAAGYAWKIRMAYVN